MQKIVTWNVNSIGMRLPRLLALLERMSPDVVCLQELKCVEQTFPFAEVAAAGYQAAVFGQKGFNGVALLSRRPADAIVRGFGDEVDDPAARFIAGRFGELTVMSAYVPNGQEVGCDKYFYKLNWLSRLRRYLDRHHGPQDPIILAGDFNVAPEARDTYDPVAWEGKILCSARERTGLLEAMEFGLVDAYRHLHPAETQFTWWDYRMLAFPKNHGLRIDLMLASKILQDKLSKCHVDRDERKGEKPSDHAPVVLEIDLP